MVEIVDVFPDGCVDFFRFVQGAVLDGAFGGCGEGVVTQGGGEASLAASPRCGVYGGANFCHFFLEVVNIFRVWMPGEGFEWFCHNDGAHGLIGGHGGGPVGHFSCSCC